MVDKVSITSPYVGPRPFEQRHQKRFFGRERETRELFSLVVAERVLLLYAESGAGKTSLVNAGLIPRLEEEKFEVLPPARVQGLIPQQVDRDDLDNIYAFNVLLSWAKEDADLERLPKTSLAQFLQARTHTSDDLGLDAPRVVILDQFEELFTAYPERWSDRRGFFEQVRDALEADPLLRVVFVIREDYIARLDPHVSLLPGALDTRFRLERLRKGPALDAVTAPLRGTGRSFAKGVAEALVGELLEVRAGTGTGETVAVQGQFVEPVQLQVVCESLWRDLPAEVTEITGDHLRAFGDVVHALSGFYERSLAIALAETGVRERKLRDWFQRTLITPAETRSTVYQGTEETGGIPNATVFVLEDLHLIRGELRAGARWYELTHDRFIEPILAANGEWYGRFQNPLPLAAQAWEASGRDEQALFRGTRLQEAQAQMEARPDELTPLEQQFVRASQEFALKQADRRRRWTYAAGGVVLLLFAILAGWSLWNARTAWVNADRAEATAEANTQKAQENQKIAEANAEYANALADEARANAEYANALADEARANEETALRQQAAVEVYWLTDDAADSVNIDRDLSVLLAVRALRRAEAAGDPKVVTRARAELEHLLQQVLQHEDWVNDIAFSPDGTLLATAGADNLVRIWDVALGRERLRLQGHNRAVLSVNFSGDGRRLASASADNTVIVWEVAPTQGAPSSVGQTGNGEALDPKAEWNRIGPMRHTSAVSGAALNDDGTILATVTANGAIKVWDVDSGQEALRLESGTSVSPSSFRDVAFSPDGKYVVAAGADGAVLVWDAETGEEIDLLEGHKGAVEGLSFDAAGDRLATAGVDKKAIVWDVTSWTSMFELDGHEDQVLDVAFSPDGAQLVAAVSDGTAVVWDLSSKTALFTLSSHKDIVNAVAFHPSGRQVATASSDHTVRLSPVSVYTGDIEQLASEACKRTNRNLSLEEWEKYVKGQQAYTQTCPSAPVHPSVVLHHLDSGEEDLALAQSSPKVVAQQYLELGSKYAEEGAYKDALAVFDRAAGLDDELKRSQAGFLADRYGRICVRASSFDGDDLPTEIEEACQKAVELAVKTDDVALNLTICGNREIEALADTVSPACARWSELWTLIPGISRYIFGLHDPGGEHVMKDQGKEGWIVFTEEIGHDPSHHGGTNYERWSNEGFGVIVRLNNGYHPRGTIPYSDQYENFARRVQSFVAGSSGAHVWVIGNNMNFSIERPQDQGFEEVITPELYAKCYTMCWQAIHSLDGHENDHVVVGAVAPWVPNTRYPGNGNGDWVQYLADVLRAIGDLGGSVDAIALQTYTHGSDPDLVTSDAKMIPPFKDRHWHFRAYRDFMNAIPDGLRHVPVYITETGQHDPWLDVENSTWVQNAYAEIDNWNDTPGNQQIHALILYRWPKFDKWYIQGKGNVIEDFRRAMENEYVWDRDAVPPPTRVAKTLYVGNLSYDTTEDDLRDLFQAYGEVVSVLVVTDRATGRSRGFAFVGMATIEGANAAIAALDNQLVDGRNVQVEDARPR